jgi:hypothetical protein
MTSCSLGKQTPTFQMVPSLPLRGSKQSKKPNRHKVISRKTVMFIKCYENLKSGFCFLIWALLIISLVDLERVPWVYEHEVDKRVELWCGKTYDCGVLVIQPYGFSPPPPTHTRAREYSLCMQICKLVKTLHRRHRQGSDILHSTDPAY